MPDPATLKSASKNNSSLKSLNELTLPIKDELNIFRDFFKKQTDTDIFLLNQIIQYLLRQKGKEIRPTLVFMTARMFGDVDKRSYIAATMIELLHTATLIHDDVVDEADKRRGFLSINKLWKNKAGVLLGDFLLSKGLLIALENEEYDMLQILSGAVKKMSEGELRQLKTARLFNMTEERYFQIISEKTASLISACCECGAAAASADKEVVKEISEIGLNIGIAFQIKDDLFDYGLDDVGKPKRNDIRERKVTLPLIKALDSASVKDRFRIKRLMKKRKKSDKNIEEIVSFVHDNNGLHKSAQAMNQFAESALHQLQNLPVKQGYEDFESLVYFIINRRK